LSLRKISPDNKEIQIFLSNSRNKSNSVSFDAEQCTFAGQPFLLAAPAVLDFKKLIIERLFNF